MNPSDPQNITPDKLVQAAPVAGKTALETELAGSKAAADMIRMKLQGLYGAEPDADTEATEVKTLETRSIHQQFMYDLTNSGKPYAEIQQAWHDYYQGLSEADKQAVWQEFYANAPKGSQFLQHTHRTTWQGTTHATEQPTATPTPVAVAPMQPFVGKVAVDPSAAAKTVADVKRRIQNKVQSRRKLQRKHHVQSLIFGLGVGSLVMVVFLFGFFNERFIAPFITPSKRITSTPLIIDSTNTTVSDPTPKVIIPKINVEIPVVYDQTSTEEDAIQSALEQGVVHYATTPSPGEAGNVVVFGHSSNNIFNQGKYKFAFVLLSRLENGDVFYLTKDGTRYAYRVYSKKIVKPTAVEVMGPADRSDTATLITCDPPGTSLNRLVVIGEQISPDPNANATSTAKPVSDTAKPVIVPSNSPSLWQRVKDWF